MRGFQLAGRDIMVLWEIANAYKSIESLLNTRRTRNEVHALLDNAIDDATPEDLERHLDCPICQQAMESGVKKLPCSHLFHLLSISPCCSLSIALIHPSHM